MDGNSKGGRTKIKGLWSHRRIRKEQEGEVEEEEEEEVVEMCTFLSESLC
jgi:hypothetical protein